MAGSESRADVAPKDESTGTVAAVDDELGRRLEEMRIKMSSAKQIDGGLVWRAGSGAAGTRNQGDSGPQNQEWLITRFVVQEPRTKEQNLSSLKN